MILLMVLMRWLSFGKQLSVIKCRKEIKDKKLYDKNDFGLSGVMWNDFFCVYNIEVVWQYFNIGYGYLQFVLGSYFFRIWFVF